MNLPRTALGGALAMLAVGAVGAVAAPAHGEWAFVPSPNAGAFTNQLFGVGGSAPDDVWAVGFSTTSLLDKPDTLAMHWDGSGWTIVPTPSPNSGLQSNNLRSVTVLGASDAWAVGSSTFGPNTSPLILRWDGSSWTQEDVTDELPSPGSLANAVHAIAADDVWVVGAITTSGTGYPTLAAHYDGSSWTPHDVPIATFGGLEFQAVHGLVGDDVWAAGYENPGSGIFSPLLSHWDGSSWSSLTPPQPGAGGTLHGVAMIAADDVWAVGRTQIVPEGDQPYAVHFDGSSWTAAPMPDFPDGHARLEGIVALATDDVWASGTNGDSNGIPRPLIMHFDGVAWQEASMPSSGGSYEWFHDMVAVGPGEVWTVGQYFAGSGTATLTARCSASTPGDLDGDGGVGLGDLIALLSAWGPCPAPPAACAADLDDDGSVGLGDLIVLLSNWS